MLIHKLDQIMKHITLLLLFVIMVTSCKKIDELTHFYMTYETSGVLDQTTVFGSPFDVLSPNIATMKDSVLSSENTAEHHVSQITLKTLFLNVANPDSIPLDYFQSIEIYLIVFEKPDKLIAWNNQIDDNEYNPFNLTLTTDDLSSYLLNPTIQYRIHGSLSGQFAIKTELELKTKYFVNATINAKK